jgi:hypothetical protein
LKEKTQKIMSATSCWSADVAHVELGYARGQKGNFQRNSAAATPELRDWWNRQDGCPAYVVQWTRGGDGYGLNGDSAFVSAIIDPGITTADPNQCPLLWVSKHLSSRRVGEPWGSSFNTVAVDTEEQQSASCSYSFDRIAWWGSWGPSGRWLQNQHQVRAVVQGFYWVFPLPVTAYLTTDSQFAACSTHCCADGLAQPSGLPAGWCLR